MRGTKAKALRREVYGDTSIRGTKYSMLSNGMVIADDIRRNYQGKKKGIDIYEEARLGKVFR